MAHGIREQGGLQEDREVFVRGVVADSSPGDGGCRTLGNVSVLAEEVSLR